MVYRPELSDTLPVWDMQLADTGKKLSDGENSL